ncbi:MAG: hypothetical protein FWG75_01575 [Cystobacterineae bacterium]|nr:hypothetical protein [Cystobacterineae bacterium]
MGKGLKTILIIAACLVGIGIVGGITAVVLISKAFIKNTFAAPEYVMGADTIKSIHAVVGERTVSSMSKETKNRTSTLTIKYRSEDVRGDLGAYTQYLQAEGGFTLRKKMDLSVMPSTIELAKESKEAGKLVLMAIEYNASGYTLIIQKSTSLLTMPSEGHLKQNTF